MTSELREVLEENKNLSHLQVHFWLDETSFYFNLVLHNLWTTSFNKKPAACT